MAMEASAVPLRMEDCVLGDAVSVTVRVAVRVPSPPGANVTVMVQVAFAANIPQELVCVKSVAFAPLMATLVMVNGAVPMLVSVRVSGKLVAPTFTLPKERFAGASLPMAVPPKPVRGTFWATLEALSRTETLAARVLMAVGEKTTVITQLAPAATEVPQLLLWE